MMTSPFVEPKGIWKIVNYVVLYRQSNRLVLIKEISGATLCGVSTSRLCLPASLVKRWLSRNDTSDVSIAILLPFTDY